MDIPSLGTAAQSGLTQAGGDINSDAATGAAVGTINKNAQQQLQIAQAQSNASLLQALGEALKSGASSISKAAQGS
jgi:hypothetical protein